MQFSWREVRNRIKRDTWQAGIRGDLFSTVVIFNYTSILGSLLQKRTFGDIIMAAQVLTSIYHCINLIRCFPPISALLVLYGLKAVELPRWSYVTKLLNPATAVQNVFQHWHFKSLLDDHIIIWKSISITEILISNLAFYITTSSGITIITQDSCSWITADFQFFTSHI